LQIRARVNNPNDVKSSYEKVELVAVK